ncbi:MAG: entericidin EcnAB [Rhodobacteraceae bacterium GWE1_64_9]|nr:entericidin A/B family lipoprotein [Gemmobacter sp.]OHC44046.1 MAG: entericidin EcnAB [Rhodobacteraceae bacterium GWE1_64_9]OHC50731.1 MAG: entericidin EcnAB [Rhodobacteraceae bacterium GWF1_65_7]HBD89467.1 entericidin EcnAB [Gemmobacter sp.]
MRMTAMLIPLLALMGLAACETVEGVGQDMQNAGSAMSQEAREAQAGL